MENNKNMELNDELMATASGGAGDIGGGETNGPKYNVGDTVMLKFGNDEGVITTVPGTVLATELTPGGWFYMIRYEANGTVYEHKYPEIAL